MNEYQLGSRVKSFAPLSHDTSEHRAGEWAADAVIGIGCVDVGEKDAVVEKRYRRVNGLNQDPVPGMKSTGTGQSKDIPGMKSRSDERILKNEDTFRGPKNGKRGTKRRFTDRRPRNEEPGLGMTVSKYQSP